LNRKKSRFKVGKKTSPLPLVYVFFFPTTFYHSLRRALAVVAAANHIPDFPAPPGTPLAIILTRPGKPSSS